VVPAIFKTGVRKMDGTLRSLVPKAKLIGILINPRSPDSQTQLNALQVAARAIGQQLRVVEAATDKELDVAFATLEQDRADALVDTADLFFNTRVELIVALAARYAIPMIHPLREFVVAGGLMSYGTNVHDAYYQNGVYVARILKGAKANDLPVLQSTKFEFVINLKAAKAITSSASASRLGGISRPSGISLFCCAALCPSLAHRVRIGM
jgi:putative tryptophan/tyrosine transport system substrate-binding protein